MENQEALQLLTDLKRVRDEHQNSVVLVLNKTDDNLSYGSGFIIKSTEESALVVTCYHVIEGGTDLWIRLAGSVEEHSAAMVYEDEGADVVILRVQMPGKYPELLFREKSEDINVGKRVFLLGYYNPYMLDGMRLGSDAFPGRISAPVSQCLSNSGFTNVLHSARTLGGCSGGPLIYEGGVIGMQFLSRTQMEYARSSEAFNKLLKKWLGIHDQEVSIHQMIGLLQP